MIHLWLVALLLTAGCRGHLDIPPVSEIPPARLERVGEFPVLHLKGTPYQMGYQHGFALRQEVRASVDNIMQFVDHHLEVPLFGRMVARFALDRTWAQMRRYVPDRYLEEMRGLADGAGIPLKTLERIHALPELTATTCASFAAFGQVTQAGRLIQIRNLDWAIQSDVQRYAAVFVYHPENTHPFVSVGWLGFMGVISGINQEGISIAEIGAETVDFSLKGIPMPFLLRRILEEADDLEEAVRIVQTAERTGGYNYLFADAQARKAVVIETTHRHAAAFWDGQWVEDPNHFFVPDAVFRSDTAFDPLVRNLQLASRGDPETPGLESPKGSGAYDVRYVKQGQLLLDHLGGVDPEVAMAVARAIAPASNLHSVVYAFPEMWVANAQGKEPAATRTYHHFDLTDLFQ